MFLMMGGGIHDMRRALHEFVHEARSLGPDDLFSHRAFLIGFVTVCGLGALSARRVHEYVVLAAVIGYVWVAAYLIRRPKLSPLRYLLRAVTCSAIWLSLWLGLRRLIG